METITCTRCDNEKHINNFYIKYSKRKDCIRTRAIKRYYNNKDKTSNQQAIFYEKNRDEILIQKQNNRYIKFKDFVRSYVELENGTKALQ